MRASPGFLHLGIRFAQAISSWHWTECSWHSHGPLIEPLEGRALESSFQHEVPPETRVNASQGDHRELSCSGEAQQEANRLQPGRGRSPGLTRANSLISDFCSQSHRPWLLLSASHPAGGTLSLQPELRKAPTHPFPTTIPSLRRGLCLSPFPAPWIPHAIKLNITLRLTYIFNPSP